MNDFFYAKYLEIPPPMSTRERPYNFDFDSVYSLQLLERSRWRVRGMGKPTLARLQNWKKKVDEHPQAFRIRIRLSKTLWFSAFCASDPYAWLTASIDYLKGVEILRVPNKNIEAKE